MLNIGTVKHLATNPAGTKACGRMGMLACGHTQGVVVKAPVILNLGSRSTSVVSYMSWPSYLCEKNPQYTLSRNLGWVLHQSECFREVKISCCWW
jgi:hypothetical protein